MIYIMFKAAWPSRNIHQSHYYFLFLNSYCWLKNYLNLSVILFVRLAKYLQWNCARFFLRYHRKFPCKCKINCLLLADCCNLFILQWFKYFRFAEIACKLLYRCSKSVDAIPLYKIIPLHVTFFCSLKYFNSAFTMQADYDSDFLVFLFWSILFTCIVNFGKIHLSLETNFEKLWNTDSWFCWPCIGLWGLFCPLLFCPTTCTFIFYSSIIYLQIY
jgi:hypothetical protein